MINPEMLDLFIYWVRERENIRRARELGYPRPWTQDSVMQKYHFCNVRREHDRGTIARRAVVRQYDLEMYDLPWVYAASNLFNDPVSLNIILDNVTDTDNHAGWAAELQHRMDKGQKVFHTAYVVTTCGAPGSKIDYCRDIIQELYDRDISSISCLATFDELRSVHGLGSFLAGQIVADLKNDRFLAHAPDWHSFSVMGPGSKKGLDFLFEGGTRERNYEARITLLERMLPPDIREMNLHRQDLQNCLCEFSKYVRYLNKLPGRSRPYV